jgi:8-oxo-dGTP pyrophosphatase MutT (NUDIX family)
MPGTVIAMYPAPIWRPTARLIVVDPPGRVLLFSALDAGGQTWWFTPGGGVRRDETLASAAVRELAEETGYVRGEPEIGPVVATCAGLWLAEDGRRFFGADSFFFVRVTNSAISTDGQEALERSIITGHRWWTPDELRGTSDVIVPSGLPDLVASLLSDGRSARPVRLPWRAASGASGAPG